MMIRSIVGMLLGAALGMLLAGTPGGALGAICGAGLGLLWGSIRPSHAGVPAGMEVSREEHKVMCIPRGEVANCVLLRDKKTGTFVEVESCSLEPEDTSPRCLKRCLDMLPQGLPQQTRKPAEVAS